jgi:hypothetical protein
MTQILEHQTAQLRRCTPTVERLAHGFGQPVVHVQDRRQGHRGLQRLAHPPQHTRSRGDTAEFCYQRGLSDAGLPLQQHHSPPPGASEMPGVDQGGELFLALGQSARRPHR